MASPHLLDEELPRDRQPVLHTPEVQGAYQLHSLGGFDLEEGGRIPDLQLAYATNGELTVGKDNAILIPTWFSGTHATWEQ